MLCRILRSMRGALIMQIINNKIYIYRGETSTYSSRIIHKEDGSPFMLLAGIDNPFIQFSVRKSLYDSVDSIINIFINLQDRHIFSTSEVVDYTEEDWDDLVGPAVGDELKLHRKVNDLTYAYYESGAWVMYDFVITFPFLREHTEDLESREYWYDIALLGGDLQEEDIPLKVIYKQIISKPNYFIVEGSVSE